MMKMNILKNGFQALIIMSLMVACSLGDVLEPSDGVSMALMETVDTVVAWNSPGCPAEDLRAFLSGRR